MNTPTPGENRPKSALGYALACRLAAAVIRLAADLAELSADIAPGTGRAADPRLRAMGRALRTARQLWNEAAAAHDAAPFAAAGEGQP
jgi:hypothetical protein